AAPATAERPDPNTVIARWNGGEIRRGAIQGALDGRFAAVPQPISPETKREIVKQVIERRVRTDMLFTEAVAKGFDKRPEVAARQIAAEEKILADDLLAPVGAAAKATDEQVVAEVDRRLAAGKPEETRKFSYIFLRAAESDPAARAAATARMAAIRKEIEGGAGFNKLAEKWSTSVTARGGGRIEWTARRSLNRAAADAIFALKKEGELSPVVAAPDGLHLFRLDGIRPGSPIDVEAIRQSVRLVLDKEAQSAAVRARRQQELDTREVELASPGELERLTASPSAAGAKEVATWKKGGAVTAAELLAVHSLSGSVQQSLAEALRSLVENRVLAAVRRTEPLSAELTARVADARRQAVIDSYRQQLVADLTTESTEDEIARYHRDHAESALFLRDFEIDALYFPQTGESVKDVYAAGEEVGEKLREGKSFDELLDRPARADAQLCRALHGVDIVRLGQTSIRLRRALLNLSPGEISPALYLDGPRTELAPKSCVLEGRGVVFVRLRSLGTLPLEASRDSIRTALKQEKEAAGVEAIQKRLIAASGLKILVPEG
ncbi:MAG TPA: peptidylprolyl isomerase, partial [Thermoanaerobaculia bacterium]|nr:peptidylprolyl isomerase [Thermoanaerobaculia bacterium]